METWDESDMGNLSVPFRSMGKKLTILILLISSLITTVTTLISFYLDYSNEMDVLQLTFDQVGKSSVSSLAQSVWSLHAKQIETQVNGILDLNDIVKVKVIDKSGKILNEARNEELSEKFLIERIYPLISEDKEELGKLYVAASQANMFERLKKKLIYIFLSQAIKTFLASIIFLFIFRQFMTRHIEKIAQFLKNYDAKKLEEDQKIELNRKNQGKDHDEIDLLTNSLNRMTHLIRGHHLQIKEYSKNLEQKIQERTQEIVGEKEKIAGLLNNMHQAVFAINSNLTVVGPVSAYAKNVFSQDIEGKKIWESIFKDLDPGSEERALFQTSLMAVFGEGELQWDLSVDYFIRKLFYQVPDSQIGEKRNLAIAYVPLWNPKGVLDKIMLVVEDVTEVEKLNAKLSLQKIQEEKNLQIIQQLANCELNELKTFLKSSFLKLEKTFELLEKINGQTLDLTILQQLFQHLHTLKGNARLYNFSSLSSLVHKAEGLVNEMQNYIKEEKTGNSFTELKNQLFEIYKELHLHSQLAKRIFKFDENISGTFVTKIHDLTCALDHLIDLSMIEAKLPPHEGLPTPQVNLEIKHITHSLKGYLLALYPEEGAEHLKALEDGLAKMPFSSLEEVASPFFKMQNKIKNIFLESDLSTPYLIKDEEWMPFFKGVYELSVNYCQIEQKGNLTETLLSEKQQLLDQLISAAEKFHLIELTYLFRKMSKVFQLQQLQLDKFDFNQKYFYDLLGSAWKYLQLVSHLNTYQLSGKMEKLPLVFETLQKMEDKRDDKRHLEVEKILKEIHHLHDGPIPLVASVFKHIQHSQIQPLDFLSMADKFLENKVDRAVEYFFTPKAYLGKDLGNKDADQILAVFIEALKRNSHASEIVGEIKNSLPYPLPLAELVEGMLGNSQKMEKGNYVLQIDLIQVFLGHREERISVKTQSSSGLAKKAERSRVLSIVPASYHRLAEAVKELQALEGIPPKIFHAFNHLLDISLQDALVKFSPMVQEISQNLGKKVMFKIKAQEATMKGDLLNQLQDAIVHLLRNSLDHGIETPEVRVAKGKKSEGIIEIECRQDDKGTQIHVRDDGRGIDLEMVKVRAIEKKLISKNEVNLLNDQEILNFIFEANFTTKKSVSDLSGRGLGMAIVRNNILALGGRYEVHNHQEKGVEFVLSF